MNDGGLLAERVAIVTGGASGLGEAIAHRLADEGATVVVADIDGAAAESVADAVVARGHNAVAVGCDVSRRADVEAMVEEAARLGAIRVLVLSAAIESLVPLTEISDDEWQAVLDVNLKGPFLCMRAAIPHMGRFNALGLDAMDSFRKRSNGISADWRKCFRLSL